MKLLEDHLRTLCPGATLGNLAPGFSHYFQPGVTLLVSVGVVVVLVLRSGLTHFENTCSVGCHVEVHAFVGLIITGGTLTDDAQGRILGMFPAPLQRALDPRGTGLLESAAKSLLQEKAESCFSKGTNPVDAPVAMDEESARSQTSLDRCPQGPQVEDGVDPALQIQGSSLDEANGTTEEKLSWFMTRKFGMPKEKSKLFLRDLTEDGLQEIILRNLLENNEVPVHSDEPKPDKIREAIEKMNQSEKKVLHAKLTSALTSALGDLSKTGDQEVSLIFLTLHFIILTYSLIDYFLLQPLPQGDLFSCKMPYLISVVSYKPVALSLWTVIAVLCQSTFVECLLGNHPCGRDPTGTCVGSPLPQNTWGVLLTMLTTGILGAWFIAALIVYLPPVLFFLPVLMIPFFVLPFGAIFLPSKGMELVSKHSNKGVDNDETGSKDPHFTGTELLKFKLDITVVSLKCAAVQLLLLFVTATPLLQIYTSEYTWLDGARDIIDVTMPNLEAIELQFKFSFQWPSFHLPRLQWQFATALGLVVVEYVLKGGTALHRWARLHSWFYVDRPHLTQAISRMFAVMTWQPFRTMMDLTKTSLEGGVNSLYTDVLHARKLENFTGKDLGPLYTGQEHCGQTMVYLCGIATCLMPIREGYRNPYTRVFSSNDTDSTVKAFCDSENALSYGAIACKDNPIITQIYGSLHSSVWLVRLSLFNCTKAKVDIELLATRLPKLKHLELHTSGQGVKMDDVTGDIKCLEQLHLQTVRLSGTKVKGSIEVFNGIKLKGLVVIEMEFCSDISGNPIALPMKIYCKFIAKILILIFLVTCLMPSKF